MSDFYYHNKHRDEEGVAHHAYEYMGEAFNTGTDSVVVLYRPLYDCPYKLFARPKEMWEGSEAYVEIDGARVPRFSKIESPEIIKELEMIRNTMYPKV